MHFYISTTDLDLAKHLPKKVNCRLILPAINFQVTAYKIGNNKGL